MVIRKHAFAAGKEIYQLACTGGETTIDYEARSEPNLLGRLFAAIMNRKLEKQIDQTLANLKRYCEASAK